MHVLAAGRVDAVGGLVAGAALHRGYRPVVLSHASPRILGPHLFFFNDTATTEIYTLSLHDALPISCRPPSCRRASTRAWRRCPCAAPSSARPCTSSRSSQAFPRSRRVRRVRNSQTCVLLQQNASLRLHIDRKSTRLNSSHT